MAQRRYELNQAIECTANKYKASALMGAVCSTRNLNALTHGGGVQMKQLIVSLAAAALLSAGAAALAKDYQVTGPVVDVNDSAITVKKGADNWEIARDKDTKSTGAIKKGDRVTIKYKMIATSIEGKAEAKGKTDDKMKADAKAKTK
jgi:hypothetical protein